MAELQRKRYREEEEGPGGGGGGGGGMGKRFCGLPPEAEELIHILEETEEEWNVVAEEDILCHVMKSLEEEISSCCCSENENGAADVETGSCEGCGDEMSYLLTASDDELGIPPSPSLIELPFYERPPESPCHEDGVWHFEDYNPNWVVSLSEEYAYEDYEEIDYGGLLELSQGEQALLPGRQETTCAM